MRARANLKSVGAGCPGLACSNLASANTPLSESHCLTWAPTASDLPTPGNRLPALGRLLIRPSNAWRAAAGSGCVPVADGGCPGAGAGLSPVVRSEEHTSELQSRPHLVCRLLLEKKKE